MQGYQKDIGEKGPNNIATLDTQLVSGMMHVIHRSGNPHTLAD